MYQPYYETLRTVPGLAHMNDLIATKKDAENATKIALRMGIDMRNIKKLTNMSIKSFKDQRKNAYK